MELWKMLILRKMWTAETVHEVSDGNMTLLGIGLEAICVTL
jgi:hypothetical protein